MNTNQIFIFCLVATLTTPQLCTLKSGNSCVECSPGTHLDGGKCFFDIPACRSYINGIECSGCQANHRLVNGYCEQNGQGSTSTEENIQVQGNFLQQNINQLRNSNNYLILRDFISRQLKGYNTQPTSVAMLMQFPVFFYELFFTRADQTQTRIKGRVNSVTYTVVLSSQQILVQGTVNQEYAVVALETQFKDFYFIVVAASIETQSKQKYLSSAITQVKRLQNDNIIKFQILFANEEIEAQIKKQALEVTIQNLQEEEQNEPTKIDIDTISLPSSIQRATVGFTRLKKAQIQTGIPLDVLNFYVGLNEQELKDSVLIAVFLQQQGFNQNYKIYHLKGNTVYQGQVANNIVRRRKFVLSFSNFLF